MLRIGIICLLVFSACGSKENKDEEVEEGGYSYEKFSARFKTITPPYQLSDTGFLKNKDTATLRYAEFEGFISDSIRSKIFGKGAKLKYVPLVHMKSSEETSLYVVKAMSGNKKAAFLMAFHKGEPGDVIPFIVPDSDPSTSQLSSIDRSYVVTKAVSQVKGSAPPKEGRDVYEYDVASQKFSWILTNPLNIENAEIINPIDTMARTHKYAGDYVKDQKNFISIRDGRSSNQLEVFLHIDNKNGCTGEFKGNLFVTGTTAIYRQSGDPCALSFRFSGNSVTVSEEEGCGAHRGLDCSFNGTYPRKKAVKPKASNTRKSSKS